MRKVGMAVALAAAVVLASCGGGGDGAAGEVDGEELFTATVLEGRAGCITCHSLAEGTNLVGPSLYAIATTAETRVPGLSAEEYLRQSILEPDAFVVDGYSAGVMPAWGEVLSDAQVGALVEYMLSLR